MVHVHLPALVFALMLLPGVIGRVAFQQPFDEAGANHDPKKPIEPFAVKLRRVGTESEGFYIGTISVGQPPQDMSVLFDTGSGQVILPGSECTNASCSEHRAYSTSNSGSSVPVNIDGSQVVAGSKRDVVAIEFGQVDLGVGWVEGRLVREAVCVGGGQVCTDVSIVAAQSMSERPFRAMPHDGIVGLGLEGLVFSKECSFFAMLRQQLPKPQFSISLRGAEGDIFFGGVNTLRPPASPVKWFPVFRPEEGYWQVRILAVRVDNVTVDACAAGCKGVVDTGASRLGTPTVVASRLQGLLRATAEPGAGCQGPTLHLDLEGGTLMLRPIDYAGIACSEPKVAGLDLGPEEMWRGLYVFGETVLRRYDTVYDWGSMYLGFAHAVPRAVRIGPPAAGLIPEERHSVQERIRFAEGMPGSTAFV